MITVEEAFRRIVETATPLTTERLPLLECSGRVLAAPLTARRSQPAANLSAMDGYAVRSQDLASQGSSSFTIIGESAAGTPFTGECGAGEAVRIFTGAIVPNSCDQVVIQEDCETNEDGILTHAEREPGRHIRPAGIDFAERQTVMDKGAYVSPKSIGLIASAGYDHLMVHRAPKIAIISTGNELVSPESDSFEPHQTVNSCAPQVATLLSDAGANIIYIGTARDELKSLQVELRKCADCDILITIGGASVGEKDLVKEALDQIGMQLNFWKVGMRPGKPLIYGTINNRHVLGLPGNPVSAFVCALLFARPLVDQVMGRPAPFPSGVKLPVATDLPANGPRQHYMRARLIGEPGSRHVDPAAAQDSSLASVLAQCDGLLVREPGAPVAQAGELVSFLPF
ncbi:MAG: molybdopterin molybdotransferase MoeA [Alphaproteobacteria bacterium]|nr:molybdopterin molybdotransferase MoeA [Alphaproteobacteria bacterium]